MIEYFKDSLFLSVCPKLLIWSYDHNKIPLRLSISSDVIVLAVGVAKLQKD